MVERERIWTECEDNWAEGIDRCANDAIAVIKEDVNGFISYLKSDCTRQDYLYITDWFDEIIQEIKSQDLVDAFRETTENRFPAENREFNISRDLDEAIEEYGEGLVH